MRFIFGCIAVVLITACAAVAVEVPPLTAAELFPEAHPMWLFLAGQTFWGAIVVGIAGFAYKLLRPYIIAWLEDKKLAKLYLAVEACTAQVQVVYVEGMKAKNADGKLTEDDKLFVFNQCKQTVIAFMQTQGIDIIKEYGDVVIDAIIELIVSRMNNPLMKAVAAPLLDSAPLPPSVSQGAMPESTGGASGLTTLAPALAPA
ncbi:MAG: hypothetical protein LUC93_04730 [Planctomycetaceae bacterium]|nr:hypothetical protein [Planctomycetaceae bacterium]